jgi:hypothetical protein
MMDADDQPEDRNLMVSAITFESIEAVSCDELLGNGRAGQVNAEHLKGVMQSVIDQANDVLSADAIAIAITPTCTESNHQQALTVEAILVVPSGETASTIGKEYGARFPTELYTRRCCVSRLLLCLKLLHACD